MFAQISSRSLAAVFGLVSFVTFASPSSAAMQCGKHDDIVKALTTKYTESRRAMGVVSAKAVMEIFMSPKGTWTILVTGTNGTSCITASGEEWQDVAVEVAGLDS
jgi:uncharacterized protein YfiM (DUF2279 family)